MRFQEVSLFGCRLKGVLKAKVWLNDQNLNNKEANVRFLEKELPLLLCSRGCTIRKILMVRKGS